MELQKERALHELKYKDEDEKFLTVALDFDGSCVFHRFPKVGREIDGCVETLRRWCDLYNVGLILDTMRSGKELEDAINWFKERSIPLFGIQKHPTQHTWTTSTKCHARWSIDDRNVGVPLKKDEFGIPYVDWITLAREFEPVLKEAYQATKS